MMKRIFTGLLTCVAAGALAQDLPTDAAQEEPVEVRRYTVEMIIFSYAQSVSAGTEVFPPEPPPVEEELVFGDMPGVMAEAALAEEGLPPLETAAPDAAMLDDGTEAEADPRHALVMLPEEDFSLIDAYERLERLDAYQPLLHFGWTQATYPDEETEARPLSSFVTPPAGLDGEVQLYLSRYLHLALNLQLQEPQSVVEDEYGDLELPAPVYYRINEDRIFRNGDLRYFDHPKFGVLAKVTRAEEAELIEEPVSEDGELLGYD